MTSEPPEGTRRRRLRLAIAGGALALIAGIGLAVFVMHRTAGPQAAPPASQGGLVVETGRDDDIKLDPKRPLRCFVAGQFVGEMPVSDCARKNGVATGALDVGLDAGGELTASVAQTSAPAPSAETSVVAEPARPAPIACQKYADGAWSRVPAQGGVMSCVASLFNGVCAPPGAALFGRFGDRTLRLMGDQVAISANNRDFRPLVDQGPGCSLPDVG